MKRWDHQLRAIEGIHRAIEDRVHSCVVAPPGAGKSLVMRDVIKSLLDDGKRVSLYVHRQALMDQTIETCEQDGISFGVIASGYEDRFDMTEPVQLCSLQTMYSRTKKAAFDIPHSDVVLIDEAHQQSEAMAQSIFYGGEHTKGHVSKGATLLGFTATPVNVGAMYRKLIYAGHYSELRACGAHIPVKTYGIESPETSGLRVNKNGEFSANQVSERMKVNTIFADVFEMWKRYNPNALPTILFAPGVGESMYFVTKFRDKGVPAAHIDGKDCYWTEWSTQAGKRVLVTKRAETSPYTRRMIFEGSREGRFPVICNRFVLREAVDLPWLYHGIFATMYGSIASYLQSVGRIQRAYPEYDHVIMTDHGGNYDRHLSPNINRGWKVGDTSQSVAKKILSNKQNSKEYDAEPICCPKCRAYRMTGRVCPQCGHQHVRSVRFVRELDGSLVKKVGRNVKFKRAQNANDVYRSALYAAANRRQSVAQALIIAKSIVKRKNLPFRIPEDVDAYTIPSTYSPERHMQVSAFYEFIRPRNGAPKNVSR